jgi:multiple sugar transport system permease protein
MQIQAKMKKRKRMTRTKLRSELFAWGLIIVPLVYLLINWIFINGQTLLLAFQDDIDGWGFMNFQKIWRDFTDPYAGGHMLKVVLNTLFFWCCNEFIGVPISLFVSFFIYKKTAGSKVFRVIFFLPSILPQMVLVTAFSQMLAPGGVVEKILSAFGVEVPVQGLLFEEATAKPTLVIYSLITAACGNIMFYSTMSRIPPELVEAGKIDGVSFFQEFIQIDFPLILPTFAMTILLDCAAILTASPPILLFGAPPGTTTVSYWFFSTVFYGGVTGIGKYGYMSALGIVFTIINLPIVLFVRSLAEKVDVSY